MRVRVYACRKTCQHVPEQRRAPTITPTDRVYGVYRLRVHTRAARNEAVRIR